MSEHDDEHDDEHDGPERRAGATFMLVERAAEIAAQNVAAIHRRRLVIWSFLAALICSLLVVLPVTIKLNHDRALASQANSRYNCAQWHEGATVLRLFVESDAKLRRDLQALSARAEVLSGFNRLLGKGVVAELRKEVATLDRTAQNYWLRDLVPRLDTLARVNCKAVLTTEGPRTTPSTDG